MRALALLLVLIAGCDTTKTEVEPVMTELDVSTPVDVDVVGVVGTGVISVPVRLLNEYGASVPGGDATVSVEGSTATLEEQVITFDASGVAMARVSTSGPEQFTVTVESTTAGVSGGASGPSWAVTGTLPTPSIDPGAYLPDDISRPDFLVQGTGGFAAASGGAVWWVPANPGGAAFSVASLPFEIEGMWSVSLDTDGVDDLVLWGEDQAVLLRGLASGGYSWGGAWEADSGEVVGMAAADLNGDRLPDVAIATSSDANAAVQVLTGDGAYHFEPTDTLSLNFTIQGVAASDEGRDGTAEITVLMSSSAHLRRYTQSDDGWIGASNPDLGEGFLDDFAEPGTVLMPTFDINEDDRNDYVLVGPSGSTQKVTFITLEDVVTYYNLNYNQAFPTLADVNGARPEELSILDADGLHVMNFMGAGADPKYDPDSFDLDGALGPTAYADGNGDGILDVGVATDIISLFDGTVTDGKWKTTSRSWRAYDASLDGVHLFADVSGDGRPDIISLTMASGSATLEIYYFDGTTDDVSLVSGDDIDLDGISADSLALCEEDGDYIIYAAVGQGTTDTLNRLRYEPGSATLTLEATQTVAGTMVACGDFAPGDVAVSNSSGAWVAYYYNSPTGEFTTTTNTGSLGTAYAVGAGDLDGDGSDELVACDTDGCSIAVGDLDGDGADEVVTGGDTLTLEDDGETSTVKGTGSVSMTDADGDGLMDVLAVDDDRGRVYILRGVDGGVTPPAVLHTSREIHAPAALGDVDGDGDLELVVEGSEGSVVHTAAE